MKGLYFDGTNLKIIEKEIPCIEKNEVLIKVIKAGICSTDLEVIKGYQNFRGILGHEFVGVVVKAFDKELLDKRVVGEINISCNKCEMCKRGLSKHCINIKTFGIKDYDGCFAEYTKLPSENIHILPGTISDDYATFVEPLAAALEVLKYINKNEKICLIGDGRLGLLISLVLKFKGFNFIHIGKHKEKLKLSEELGISTHLFDKKNINIFKYKFDSVIEATGNESGLNTSLNICIPTGKVILKSTFHKDTHINLSSIVVNENILIGSRCGDFTKAINFINEYKSPLNRLITNRYPFEQIIYALNNAKKGIKTIIDIS